MSPMCQYSCDNLDGFANNWHMTHIGARAVGGVGLIIMEATAVEPEGRITPHDLGLWRDEHIDFLKSIVDFVHSQHKGQIKIGIQLAHAGRKASTTRLWENSLTIANEDGGWDVVGPSPIPWDNESKTPRELTVSEIKGLVQKWVDAAKRAVKAGFDVIEIHGAHGYLISEFLSPLSNVRTDEYGGSFENRIRFLSEIAQAVRAAIPETMPLFVRISATEYAEGGWGIEDSVKLAQHLKTLGVDLVDCSSGGNIHTQKINPFNGYQIPFAEAVRRDGGIASAAVGRITDPKEANEIIASGKADLVMIGRELLANPHWPVTAAKALGYKGLPVAPQYCFGIRF
eukprot:GEZU01005477.1.p1 GENE.GEZU01005477.1~~GEZU01005477.1.p1  ORF type:complete len:342 (+),score=88.40 GEZU01005477.1:103-1128(+)